MVVAVRIGSVNLGGTTAFDPERPLLLLHIYKTGGSSIRLGIERTFDVRRIQGIYHTDDLRSRAKGYVNEENTRNNGAELYYGHFFYGLHTTLGVPATYGTFLRDPVERAVSHYRHFERFSDGPAKSLTEHLDDGNEQLDNLMTRMLSGHRAMPFGEIRQAHLDDAKRNLERFVFVGFVDAMAESMEALGGVLGGTIAATKSINVNEQPAPVSEAEADRLTVLNSADQELFDFARELADR